MTSFQVICGFPPPQLKNLVTPMVVGMESWLTRKWGIGEKSLTTFVLDGNLLTIQHLASLERPAHQKTNLTTLCKNLSDF